MIEFLSYKKKIVIVNYLFFVFDSCFFIYLRKFDRLFMFLGNEISIFKLLLYFKYNGMYCVIV